MKRKNIFFFISREHATRMRNGSRFASFRFEAKNFFCETGLPYSVPDRSDIPQVIAKSVLSSVTGKEFISGVVDTAEVS
jgi:hypothetical protein